MHTEFLNVDEGQVKSTRRKSIAVITSTMANTFRAEFLSLLTVALADRGWDVTIITSNRQGFFDFLVDERARRHSMDNAYHKPEQRPARLSRFVQEHPEIEHYLFLETRMQTFPDDFQVISEAGKHIFLYVHDCLNEAIKDVASKQKIAKYAAKSDALISGFPLDRVLYNTTFIPYLHPYAMEDLSQAELGEQELLLLTAGSSIRTNMVVRSFAELVKTDKTFRDKHLRIVPVEKALEAGDVRLLKTLAGQYPENIFLEPFCEKPHKVLNGYAGVVVVDDEREYPKILSTAVGKGLPALLVKGYDDYCVGGFNKGFRICNGDNAESLQTELRQFFDSRSNQERSQQARQAVSETIRNEIFDRWENVLLGNAVSEYVDLSDVGVLKSALLYSEQCSHVWLEKYSEAALYNKTGTVRRAKDRAAGALGENKRHPFARLAYRTRRKLKHLIAIYKRWERNKFFDRSYIDTDMATRKKVQLLILKIYIEFERICRKNGYRFYIAGGTLLGAVRHKGFIPWDDDLDVVMPRKDYDAFLKHCEAELREGFVLNAHAYPYTFTRLEVLGPRTTAPLQRKGRNIFLDILPLDCACEDAKKKEKHGSRSDKLRKAMMDEAKLLAPVNWKNRKAVVCRLFRKIFCPYSVMIKKWTRNATKYQSDNAKSWVCLPGDYGYDGESFPVEYWGEPVMMEFEGMQVPAMNKWETYLTEHYGEYMLYPPVSQRSLKHKIFSIDLERYENMSVEEMAQEVSDDYFASTGKRVSFLKEAEKA